MYLSNRHSCCLFIVRCTSCDGLQQHMNPKHPFQTEPPAKFLRISHWNIPEISQQTVRLALCGAFADAQGFLKSGASRGGLWNRHTRSLTPTHRGTSRSRLSRVKHSHAVRRLRRMRANLLWSSDVLICEGIKACVIWEKFRKCVFVWESVCFV